jgi:hypothetical protein
LRALHLVSLSRPVHLIGLLTPVIIVGCSGGLVRLLCLTE